MKHEAREGHAREGKTVVFDLGLHNNLESHYYMGRG
jgi:hypothetical protein